MRRRGLWESERKKESARERTREKERERASWVENVWNHSIPICLVDISSGSKSIPSPISNKKTLLVTGRSSSTDQPSFWSTLRTKVNVRMIFVPSKHRIFLSKIPITPGITLSLYIRFLSFLWRRVSLDQGLLKLAYFSQKSNNRNCLKPWRL